MLIRIIQPQEVLPALRLIWEVYALDVAPLQKPEAVAGFRQFILYDNINPRVQNREMILFGAWEGNELCGVSGVDNRGNILFLYVRKHWQRKGVGRALMQSMYQFCGQTLVVTRVMMRAFPSAVTAMIHLGMRECDPGRDPESDAFVPMEMMIAPGSMKPERNRSRIILFVVIAIALGVALIGLLAAMIYNEARNVFDRSYSYTYEETLPFDDFYDDYGGGSQGYGNLYDDYGNGDAMSGISSIPEYTEQDLDFEVTEESYLYFPEDTKTTYVDFEIYYPQIEGLEDSNVQDKVNGILKDCAMESVERIYENPDTKIKERVLKEEYPVLADYVKYKVTYLTEDYICVAFEDYSYEGSYEAGYIGLRTKNINLKDGSVYEVRDILELSDDFVTQWLDGMRQEAEEESLLSELDTDGLKKALAGEDTKEGVYLSAFFVDEKGIEIGFSFHYDQEDENNSGYGWVTAPFDLEELKDYQKENPFWELVK